MGVKHFVKDLSAVDRVSFLTELFNLQIISPGYSSPLWIAALILVFVLGGFSWPLFICFFFVILWYMVYYVALLMLIYKWKKKHLNSS